MSHKSKQPAVLGTGHGQLITLFFMFVLPPFHDHSLPPYSCSPRKCQHLRVFVFLAMPWGMWDLSFLTRDQTHVPCSGSIEYWSLDHQGSPQYWSFVFYFLRIPTGITLGDSEGCVVVTKQRSDVTWLVKSVCAGRRPAVTGYQVRSLLLFAATWVPWGP